MVSEDVSGSAIDVQIHVIRGVSVMLDFDLASLYGVANGVLLQAVRRNQNRFPANFTFALSAQEVTRLRSQIVISKIAERRGDGTIRLTPLRNEAWRCSPPASQRNRGAHEH
jgi:predicted glycosyltransferase